MKKIKKFLIFCMAFFSIFLMFSSISAVPNFSGKDFKVNVEKTDFFMEYQATPEPLFMGFLFIFIILALIVSNFFEWVLLFIVYMDDHFSPGMVDFITDHTLIFILVLLFHPASWMCLLQALSDNIEFDKESFSSISPLFS